MRLSRQAKAYIEAEIRDYYITKKEFDELTDDLLSESPLPLDGMPRGSGVSDPTVNRYFKLKTNRRLRYMEGVVDAIEQAIEQLDDEKLRFMHYKYWQKPKQLTDAGIALKMNIDKRTVYKWSDSICEKVGINLGIFDVVKAKNRRL